MKKLFTKFALFISVLGFAASASAASVYFDFNGDMLADYDWKVADFANPISGDLYIDGIDPAIGLVGFGLNISYDPMLVAASAASVNVPTWFVPPGAPVIDNVAGNVLLEGLSFSALSGTILLGSVTFDATDAFSLSLIDKDPTVGGDFSGPFPGLVDYDQVINFLPDTTVSAVPLPGAALLFGSGLLGLAGLKRKRGKKITS